MQYLNPQKTLADLRRRRALIDHAIAKLESWADQRARVAVLIPRDHLKALSELADAPQPPQRAA